ncbi:hypothetical protein AFK67_11875 [Cronobacter dublinensis subsp. dublinensis LMG 23823]|nr:hypothetical protein AFK67_11875 [Cronobacter dublinensis subsp. dublinensis LMG 23823]
MRAATVSHYLTVFRQFSQSGLKFFKRDIQCPGQVSTHIFIFRAYIQEGHATGLKTTQQLFPADGFQTMMITVVVRSDIANDIIVELSKASQAGNNASYRAVTQTIDNVLSFPAGHDKAASAEVLQVLRSACGRHARQCRKHLNRQFPPSQMFKYFNP